MVEERFETVFAHGDRFVMYEHTTTTEANGPGLELIDLWAVGAVGWQPATDSSEPYGYLQLGEQRRRFYTSTDAEAQAWWELMSVRWMWEVDHHRIGTVIEHPYRAFKSDD